MLCDWLICPAVPCRHGGLFYLGEFLFALLVVRHFIANFDAKFASLWIKKYRRMPAFKPSGRKITSKSGFISRFCINFAAPIGYRTVLIF